MLGFMKNIRGGFIGVVSSMILWVAVYFTAFMTAFGNFSAISGAILDLADVFFSYFSWLLPLAYILGAYFIR